MPYGSVDNKDPIFKLARPVESADKPYLEEIKITPESKILYDGAPDTTENIENSEAYLIVGEFIRTGKTVTTNTDEGLNFSDFKDNYVFTRRGLEEYRYEYSADKNTPALDFGYTKDLDAIKVFWSTFMSNSILFKQEGSQRDQYGDFLRFSRASDIKLAADGTVTGGGVVYDLIFATFQDTYQDKYDLKDLMSSHDYPKVPALYSCKWIQDNPDTSLANSESFILSESITPQLALLDRIAGRPILSRVATAMKRGDAKIFNSLGDEATSLSPNSLSAMIPVALIMRPFNEGKGVNKCAVGNAPKLNPDLVISYFDLYQGANECINIGLSAENIYSTVSVLD